MGSLGSKHEEGNKRSTRMPLEDVSDKQCHVMFIISRLIVQSCAIIITVTGLNPKNLIL